MSRSSFTKILDGFPETKGVRWFNLAVLTLTPMISLLLLVYNAGNHSRQERPVLKAPNFRSQRGQATIDYGLTVHTMPLYLFNSSFWPEALVRFKDLATDPYNSNRGLLWTHIGWMLYKTDLRSGPSDVSDLKQDALIQWQHRHYFVLLVLFGVFLPVIIPGLIFEDWWGGFCFAAALRLTVAHHSTFCINSIAHWLGDSPYDDALSPRDHFLSSILTMGEGYHNFHHQFPMDYRNAFLWYQYDPTKWFIGLCSAMGLASNLRVFPSNEIEKGRLAMKLKALKQIQDTLIWPKGPEDLPIVSWETFKRESTTRPLILIAGFIHDVSSFLDHHPGGRSHLVSNSGQDMTAAFFGGLYAHSNAAHNLLTMMRVGILDGGMEIVHKLVDAPPFRKLYIAHN